MLRKGDEGRPCAERAGGPPGPTLFLPRATGAASATPCEPPGWSDSSPMFGGEAISEALPTPSLVVFSIACGDQDSFAGEDLVKSGLMLAPARSSCSGCNSRRISSLLEFLFIPPKLVSLPYDNTEEEEENSEAADEKAMSLRTEASLGTFLFARADSDSREELLVASSPAAALLSRDWRRFLAYSIYRHNNHETYRRGRSLG